MKKLTILAVLALVAGVSCTKSIPVSNNSPDTPITFSPFSIRNATKAVYGEVGTAYNTSESFKAYSYFTEQSSTTAGYNPQALVATPDATKGSEFFSGVQCNYNNTYNAWETATPYYWPRAGYLHFHAISPASLTVSHSWVNGFSISDYVAPVYTDSDTGDDLSADGSQIDLLYSDFVFDKQRSGYNPQAGVPYDDATAPTYNGVDITFRHALSAIKFKVKTDANYDDNTKARRDQFVVKKIEILNAYNTGDFHENRDDEADNTYLALPANAVGFTPGNTAGVDLTPYWDDFDNEIAAITPYNATTGTGTTASYVATYDPTSAAIGTTILALPQPLDHGINKVQIRVTYDYKFTLNGDEADPNDIVWHVYNTLTSTLDIAGFYAKLYNGADATNSGASLGYLVNNWLINHKYTYVLNFKLDPIIFDPAVTAWVEVDNIGVDLPAQN